MGRLTAKEANALIVTHNSDLGMQALTAKNSAVAIE